MKLKKHMAMVGILCMAMCTVQPVFATTIWERFLTIVQDIYAHIVAISTDIAVTVATIALIIRLASCNHRAVDEATSWLKRILITRIILNSLGFIVVYLQPLNEGENYTPSGG